MLIYGILQTTNRRATSGLEDVWTENAAACKRSKAGEKVHCGQRVGKVIPVFLEINLEKQPSLRQFFTRAIDVKKTCELLSITLSVPIVAGETLLFIDEIQVCQEAIMALRYFKEDYPELHVIAAGSLLEFALEELLSYGVGRIRSLYMYPFSFDEFLTAQGLRAMVDYRPGRSI